MKPVKAEEGSMFLQPMLNPGKKDHWEYRPPKFVCLHVSWEC